MMGRDSGALPVCEIESRDADGRWDAGESTRLLADNVRLADRLHRLGPAMVGMAHDLAHARRENALLRRENVRLQLLADVSAATCVLDVAEDAERNLRALRAR